MHRHCVKLCAPSFTYTKLNRQLPKEQTKAAEAKPIVFNVIINLKQYICKIFLFRTFFSENQLPMIVE